MRMLDTKAGVWSALEVANSELAQPRGGHSVGAGRGGGGAGVGRPLGGCGQGRGWGAAGVLFLLGGTRWVHRVAGEEGRRAVAVGPAGSADLICTDRCTQLRSWLASRRALPAAAGRRSSHFYSCSSSVSSALLPQ